MATADAPLNTVDASVVSNAARERLAATRDHKRLLIREGKGTVVTRVTCSEDEMTLMRRIMSDTYNTISQMISDIPVDTLSKLDAAKVRRLHALMADPHRASKMYGRKLLRLTSDFQILGSESLTFAIMPGDGEAVVVSSMKLQGYLSHHKYTVSMMMDYIKLHAETLDDKVGFFNRLHIPLVIDGNGVPTPNLDELNLLDAELLFYTFLVNSDHYKQFVPQHVDIPKINVARHKRKRATSDSDHTAPPAKRVQTSAPAARAGMSNIDDDSDDE